MTLKKKKINKANAGPFSSIGNFEKLGSLLYSITSTLSLESIERSELELLIRAGGDGCCSGDPKGIWVCGSRSGSLRHSQFLDGIPGWQGPQEVSDLFFTFNSCCYFSNFQEAYDHRLHLRYKVFYPTLYALESENKDAKLFNCIQVLTAFSLCPSLSPFWFCMQSIWWKWVRSRGDTRTRWKWCQSSSWWRCWEGSSILS